MANDTYFYVNYRSEAETEIYVNQYKVGEVPSGAGSDIINGYLREGENSVSVQVDGDETVKVSVAKKHSGDTVSTETGNILSEVISSGEELSFQQEVFDTLPSAELFDDLAKEKASRFAKDILDATNDEADENRVKKALDIRAKRFAPLNDVDEQETLHGIYQGLAEPEWEVPEQIEVEDVYLGKVWRTQEIEAAGGDDDERTYMTFDIAKVDDDMKLI